MAPTHDEDPGGPVAEPPAVSRGAMLGPPVGSAGGRLGEDAQIIDRLTETRLWCRCRSSSRRVAAQASCPRSVSSPGQISGLPALQPFLRRYDHPPRSEVASQDPPGSAQVSRCRTSHAGASARAVRPATGALPKPDRGLQAEPRLTPRPSARRAHPHAREAPRQPARNVAAPGPGGEIIISSPDRRARAGRLRGMSGLAHAGGAPNLAFRPLSGQRRLPIP